MIGPFTTRCLLALGAALLLAGNAEADVPRRLNFQGRLANASSQPLTGAYSITFGLWTTQTVGTGTSCYQETVVVPVNSGLFNVRIGSGSPAGISTCAFDQPLFLQLQVAGDVDAMSPRLALHAAPYAIDTALLDGQPVDGYLSRDPITGNVSVPQLGVGMTPVRTLDAAGSIRATELCIASDCKTAWPAGTYTSITGTSGVLPSPATITTTGSLALDDTVVQRRVTGICTASQAMRQIAVGGTTVVCENVPPLPTGCTFGGRSYGFGATCMMSPAVLSGSQYRYYKGTCLTTGAWSVVVSLFATTLASC